jgi:hypothetical protein
MELAIQKSKRRYFLYSYSPPRWPTKAIRSKRWSRRDLFIVNLCALGFEEARGSFKIEFTLKRRYG